MAKKMIPEELDALIHEYLTDGIITDKERRVLLNKAQQMGLNVDEIDLYIDAQQQKVDMAAETAASKKRGKTCPFCGSLVPMLTDKCPACGGTITAEAGKELQEIFDNLEEALVNLKAASLRDDINKYKGMVERYVRKAKTYYGSNPKVLKLLDEVKAEVEEKERSEKKFTIIFLIIALSLLLIPALLAIIFKD